MEKKDNKKNNKKKIVLILLGVLFIFIVILLLILLLSGKKIRTYVEEKEVEIRPYVEEKEIEILPADGEYSISVEPYFKDVNKNVIDLEGITWSKTASTYRFYDYSVTEPDSEGYVTHTFNVDITTPIEYVEESNRTYPYNKYTSVLSQPSIFDYYTGTVLKEVHLSKNNTVNYYDVKPTEEDMAFTEVSWKDKTYRIGVKIETSMKWDGINKTDNGNGTRTVKDKSTTFIEITIYAPKEYDGLMVFFNKKGTTKQNLFNQIEYNNKYNELVKEFNETGEKSEELQEMEERNTRNFKLLESKVKGEPELKNDTFYVFKVSDIKEKK